MSIVSIVFPFNDHLCMIIMLLPTTKRNGFINNQKYHYYVKTFPNYRVATIYLCVLYT